MNTLQQHAARQLDLIRESMARSAAFTALPGWGGVGMGVVGSLAAVVAARAATPADWLQTWLVAAAVAVPLGMVTMAEKARRAGVDLRAGTARRFVLGLSPPILAGAVLTVGAWTRGAHELLPAIWLTLYGTATLVGGAVSVTLVPIMGSALLVLGGIAAVTTLPVANALLGIGFGGLQIVFGLLIVRRYGG